MSDRTYRDQVTLRWRGRVLRGERERGGRGVGCRGGGVRERSADRARVTVDQVRGELPDGQARGYIAENHGAPLRLPPELDFAALFHGVDERVPVESVLFGTRVFEHFLHHS